MLIECRGILISFWAPELDLFKSKQINMYLPIWISSVGIVVKLIQSKFYSEWCNSSVCSGSCIATEVFFALYDPSQPLYLTVCWCYMQCARAKINRHSSRPFWEIVSSACSSAIVIKLKLKVFSFIHSNLFYQMNIPNSWILRIPYLKLSHPV